MKLKLITLILISVGICRVWAFPVVDINQQAKDFGTLVYYSSMIKGYVDKLSQSISIVEQIKTLKSLDQLKATGGAICELCTPIEQQQLTLYLEQVNTDLCSQFQFAMDNIKGLQTSINSIEAIIRSAQVNPQTAALALQQAAIQASISTANTLNQIQLLIAQQEQKRLAQQKLERQVTLDVYTGFKSSGL